MNSDLHTPAAAATVEPYPRSWMQPFLNRYLSNGHLAQSAAECGVSPASVRFQVEHHLGFAAAFEDAQAIVAERIWDECKHRAAGGGVLIAIPSW